MTMEEAIKSLMRCEAESHCRHYTETFRCDGCNKREALDMAIKALMAIEALPADTPKPHGRLIDVSDLSCESIFELDEMIKNAPTIIEAKGE